MRVERAPRLKHFEPNLSHLLRPPRLRIASGAGAGADTSARRTEDIRKMGASNGSQRYYIPRMLKLRNEVTRKSMCCVCARRTTKLPPLPTCRVYCLGCRDFVSLNSFASTGRARYAVLRSATLRATARPARAHLERNLRPPALGDPQRIRQMHHPGGLFSPLFHTFSKQKQKQKRNKTKTRPLSAVWTVGCMPRMSVPRRKAPETGRAGCQEPPRCPRHPPRTRAVRLADRCRETYIFDGKQEVCTRFMMD